MLWVLLEDQDVVRVFEAPEGVALHMAAFLESLGLRPHPQWSIEAAKVNPQWVSDWNEELHRWHAAKDALIKEKGVTDLRAAHRAWIEAREDVRSIPFEEI